jgi:hypothetical protein
LNKCDTLSAQIIPAMITFLPKHKNRRFAGTEIAFRGSYPSIKHTL